MNGREVRIPILEYHSVNDRISRQLAVPVSSFEMQMRYLVEEGYTPISVDELSKSYASTSHLHLKPILITFDDGYRDNYVNAYPILNRFGFKATVFLATDYIDRTAEFSALPASLEGKNILSWDEIREMKEGGIAFGSHTCSHSILPIMQDEQAESEIRKSKSRIEDQLGVEVVSFCYPNGRFNQKIREMVVSSHYLAACAETFQDPNNEDLFCLRRIRISRGDNMLAFRFKLSRLFLWVTKRHSIYRSAIWANQNVIRLFGKTI